MKQNLNGKITVTVPIINEPTLPRQLFVETSCTKCHENPTNRIGADTWSQTEGRACSTHKALLFHHKERLKVTLFIRFREIKSIFFWKPCETQKYVGCVGSMHEI